MALLCQVEGFSKAKKFAIGIVFSPDYCYRITTDPSVNSNEVPLFGYTTGLNFLWQLNKRFSLEAGVLYSVNGYQTKDLAIVYGFSRSNPPYQPGDPVSNRFIYKYTFLDIPLKVDYYLRKTGVKLFVSAGLSTNIFMSENDTYKSTYNDGHTVSGSSTGFYSYSTVNFAILAGIGTSFHISRQLLVRIEPVYRQFLTPSAYSPIRDYLYSIGVNTGLYFRF
jgi:hypothetical protein